MSIKTEYIFDSANNDTRVITVHTIGRNTVVCTNEVSEPEEIEFVDFRYIANNQSNHAFADNTFDIVANLEEQMGCPLATH